MKFIDIRDLRDKTSMLLDSLEEGNVVLIKEGEPVAIIQNLKGIKKESLSMEVISELLNTDDNLIAQYTAMVKVWGDPKCDIYDEAFMDD
jgi:antitoxin (DNA-binding transcriptional repressor) of toxin-antitoxin stability system